MTEITVYCPQCGKALTTRVAISRVIKHASDGLSVDMSTVYVPHRCDRPQDAR